MISELILSYKIICCSNAYEFELDKASLTGEANIEVSLNLQYDIVNIIIPIIITIYFQYFFMLLEYLTKKKTKKKKKKHSITSCNKILGWFCF